MQIMCMDQKSFKSVTKCIICDRYRTDNNFTKGEINSIYPKCYDCRRELREQSNSSVHTSDNGMKKYFDVKERQCLRCNKHFSSYRDRRLCPDCKAYNAHVDEGMIYY